jgi:integrase
MKDFVRFYGKSPEGLDTEDVEKYLHSLLLKGKSSSGIRQAYSAIKFFYCECLGRPQERLKLPQPKVGKRLPIVLSPEEVKEILQKVNNRRNKLVLMLIYSTGMRLRESLNLRIKDIDSKRMEIRVNQGKGNKDRYTLLSKVMVNKLREYYKENRPKDYLFTGKYGKPLNSSTIQRAFTEAKKKRSLPKTQQYTPYGTALQRTY